MKPSRKSYIPIICTFIIGVAVSLTFFVIVKNWEQTNHRIKFESRSRGYANAVQGNLTKYLEALNSLGAFFNNSQQVTRQEFTFFAESALSRHPAIQAVSWNPLVMGNERAVYESLAKKEGLKNFKFTERTEKGALVDAAQRQEYVVVYYIVPLETNKPALGYDIASDAIRLQAIDQAFKTGELTATGRITLVQETGTQFGVLIFSPIYQQGVSLKTSEARLKYRKGLVVEVLRLGDVVEAALKDFPDEGINVCLYDISAEKGNRLLHTRLSRTPGMTEHPTDEEEIQEGLHWSSNFKIAGRQWKLLFTPSPLFLDSKHSWQSWLSLSGVLLLTAILGAYLLRRLKYTTEIELRAREQLRTNQELANEITERKKAEENLKETLESLRKSFGVTIQVMVSAIEARDPYTAGHQVRVADLARAIATEMRLSQEKIDGIRMAGSIHDIGKLSIPAEILSKPTKLSDIEFSLIKEHSRKGYEMLKDVESPWPLAEIVYQHHERMNGSGYPRNLKGDDILMEARILSVADVVEAMASHRPYRPSLGIDAALEEIEKNKGVLYYPEAVDACLKLFREKDFQFKDN